MMLNGFCPHNCCQPGCQGYNQTFCGQSVYHSQPPMPMIHQNLNSHLENPRSQVKLEELTLRSRHCELLESIGNVRGQLDALQKAIDKKSTCKKDEVETNKRSYETYVDETRHKLTELFNYQKCVASDMAEKFNELKILLNNRKEEQCDKAIQTDPSSTMNEVKIVKSPKSFDWFEKESDFEDGVSIFDYLVCNKFSNPKKEEDQKLVAFPIDDEIFKENIIERHLGK
jgi:DNA-binding FrmR family transcriptional regulator